VRELELLNTSVEYLNICGFPENEGDHNADYFTVVSFFKSLKTIEIEMNNHLETDLLLLLHPILSRLESLIITFCSGEYFNTLALPSLKALQLTDGTPTVASWVHFAQRNPSIESLIIKDESITSEVFRTICTEFRSLKHLEINYDPQRLTNEILGYIFSPDFPTNIRSLKITQRASPSERFLVPTTAQLRTLDMNPGLKCIFN
jgi:hypothetical protein